MLQRPARGGVGRACSVKIFSTSRLSWGVRLPRPPVTSYFWLTHLRTFAAS